MTTDRSAAARLPLVARCRLAFLVGALEAWREANDGANPPPVILSRIAARYPGDPPTVATRVRRPAER